jgi:4a-hydroxytetrahydrobiopterin dehydratase
VNWRTVGESRRVASVTSRLTPPLRLFHTEAIMSDKKTYTDDEVKAKIAEYGLAEWYLEDGWLRRKYNTDGWPQTLMAVNAIGYLCEAAWHHADLSITWGKLWVKLKTHDAGGITDKDFELARKIEEVVLWRPTGGTLTGNPKKFVFSKT